MITAKNSRSLILAFQISFLVVMFSSFSFVTYAQHYDQTNLISDLPGLATHTDPNLKNPWGLTRGPSSPWWISLNVVGKSAVVNGSGDPITPPPPLPNPFVVNIPVSNGSTQLAHPTGTVFNGTSAFEVAPGLPAAFIFVTLEGTISAWNPAVDPNNAIVKVPSSGQAVYTGVTIAEMGADHQPVHHPVLYAANFRAGRIDVFDANFAPIQLSAGQFRDSTIPDGFAPFNVQAIGRNIYVMYAKPGPAGAVRGDGLGFVSIFSRDGELEGRLQNGLWLNAPWGIALAPGEFGEYSHSLIVGQFGSGRIVAYNPVTNRFAGFLRHPDNSPIQNDRLWALWFGNSGSAGPYNSLFFTAGIENEEHGLFGTLTAVPEELNEGDEP
jgi:uncharacterized protein (TIGR03118 family)